MFKTHLVPVSVVGEVIPGNSVHILLMINATGDMFFPRC